VKQNGFADSSVHPEVSMTQLLIVEDSATQALQLSLLLQDAGFEVEIAADAERGYSLIAEGRFDLVVSDVNLPGESGFALCRKIKANPDLKNLPVLIITADSDPSNVLRGLEAGADGFMTKNHSPAQIVHRVQRTIAGGVRMMNVGGVDYTQAVFRGNEFLLRTTVKQLLNVLLSSFEDVIDLNDQLRSSEVVLRELNVELHKVNEAVTEANRVKDKFLGIAAHDLRNPIGAINGMASVLLEDGSDLKPDERQQYLQHIMKQTDSMLRLLHDLLDISAIRGGFELKSVLQNPIEVLRAAFNTFVLPAREKNIRLVWEVPDNLPAAEFDFNLLLEVISNLISNALKFCAKGQSVRLLAHTLNSHLEICVCDTGPGIKQEELPQLFEPFNKLSNKPTAGEKSTGLGLSIVREILTLHGGRVSAESSLGHGTTFRVELPLHRRPAGTN
jgi:two-component system, sensor histidine kinase and response regulator